MIVCMLLIAAAFFVGLVVGIDATNQVWESLVQKLIDQERKV